MAAQAGSLVVRISADMNDFSKKLSAMHREVATAAKGIANIGRSMSLGITIPVGLAMIALTRMGAENEQVARKMDRVFGSSVKRVQHNLEELMKVVPETGTELQMMAINLTEVGDQLGFAGNKANLFAEGTLAIAAAISNGKMVPFAEALEATQKAMLGQTRGLKAVGIVLDETQIKNEAYRLGLLGIRQELTPLGKAQATYSLLTKATAGMMGEAGAQAQDTARNIAFLKRDFLEFADATSNLVVPALRVLVGMGRAIVDGLNALPDWFRTLALTVAAVAAAMGPLLFVSANLIGVFTKLRMAITLLMAAEGLAGFVALLANPVVVAALAALALAVGGIAYAWTKFGKDAKPVKLDITPPPDISQLLGGATGQSPAIDALAAFQKHASAITTAFDQTLSQGTLITGIFDKVVNLNKEALDLYDKQANKLGEMALAAQSVATATRLIMASGNIVVSGAQYGSQQDSRQATRTGSFQTTTNVQLKFQAAAARIQEEGALRFREMLLGMTDTFDAVRTSFVELGEQARDIAHSFAVTVQSFKTQWSGVKNIGTSAMLGLKAGVSSVLAGFTPLALVASAISAVMQGLQPVLDALFVPLVMLGRIVGIILTPLLKALFIPLKYLGIAVALVGEVLARVVAGIASGIGSLLIGLGNLINKLPGSPGNGIKRAGEAMKNFADGQYETADQLKRARRELSELTWEDAVNGVDKLAEAADTAAEALTNLPTAFKYALRKFQAANPLDVDRALFGATPNGGGSAAVRSPYTVIPTGAPAPVAVQGNERLVIQVDGRALANVMLGRLRTAAQSQLGDASRIADLTSVR